MICSVQKENHIQPHEKCQTFQWLVIIALSETFHTKLTDILVRRSFSYPVCTSVWIYWCLCIYMCWIFLRKWRRKVKILFWFEGLCGIFTFFTHILLWKEEKGKKEEDEKAIIYWQINICLRDYVCFFSTLQFGIFFHYKKDSSKALYSSFWWSL